MGALAAAGIRAGALGFSTWRTTSHRSSSGEHIPTLTAGRDELVGIASAIGATGRGVLQVTADASAGADEHEILLAKMRASGLPLSVTLLQYRGTDYRDKLALLERANAEGLAMRAQIATRAVGVMLGLQTSMNPLLATPTYLEVADLPLAEQVRRLSTVDARARLFGDLTTTPPRWSLDRVFDLGEIPDYEPEPAASVAERARAAGVAAEEMLIDLLLQDGGTKLLYVAAVNYCDGDFAAISEMLAHPHTIPGLSDGGAHVGIISDASFPTTLLSHWGRDRTRGRTFDVAFLVGQQCRATAEAVGLRDRGVLLPGYKADLNVIDFERLGVSAPRMVCDLPAGGQRLLQDAHGYLHTVVSGVETYANGASTGELPGRLVRWNRANPR